MKSKTKKKNRPATSKALAVRKKEEPQGRAVPATLSLANPHDVMEFGKTLKSYIEKNKLSTKIKDKSYAHVDGWKYAGLNFGLTAIPRRPESRHVYGQYMTILYIQQEMKAKAGGKPWTKEVPVFVGFSDHKDVIEDVRKHYGSKITRELTRPYISYACECDIVKLSDGTKVSYGEGMCSNMEPEKSGNEEYAINSMAQTRSIGKGYRNLIGFVMNAAGFEGTPKEEMDAIAEEELQRDVTPQPNGKMTLRDKGFKDLLSRVIAGDTAAAEKARNAFNLTPSQLEALEVAEKNGKERKPD